jgi:hypothetical protein
MRLLYDQGDERVSFPIPEGEIFIGRKEYCDLCFPDASVSKTHVRLLRKGSRLKLEDAGSRNGTMVNGKIVDGVELVTGDVIQLGKIALEVDLDGGADRGNRKSKKVDRNDISEVPSDEELDRQLAKGKNSRSDSFRDFDDFDKPRASRRRPERAPPEDDELDPDSPTRDDEPEPKKEDAKKSGAKASQTQKDSAPKDAPQKASGEKKSGEKAPAMVARFVWVVGP